MNSYKILFLLITLVLFVNFINYFAGTREKNAKMITLLQTKIAKEKKLNNEKIDKEKLKIPQNSYFFDATKQSYSQSMGKMQEMINIAAQNNCSITYLKWAQLPVTTASYEKMKINTALECSPRAVFSFINALRAQKKLFFIENFQIAKQKNKKLITLNMQLVAFRINNAKK